MLYKRALEWIRKARVTTDNITFTFTVFVRNPSSPSPLYFYCHYYYYFFTEPAIAQYTRHNIRRYLAFHGSLYSRVSRIHQYEFILTTLPSIHPSVKRFDLKLDFQTLPLCHLSPFGLRTSRHHDQSSAKYKGGLFSILFFFSLSIFFFFCRTPFNRYG